ncbi:MAG: phosphate transport regulator [Pseudomonadota bacterium]|nr:phosphate transport regulator [Pseudomonadota bacterium]
MEKLRAVESLGQQALLLPSRITLALRANDRLKLCLTLLQAAAMHARQPEAALADLRREIAAAGVAEDELAAWLRDLPAQARVQGDGFELPGWARLAQLVRRDLLAMGAPCSADAALTARVGRWTARLDASAAEFISAQELDDLTRGDRAGGDSLHLLVMDLHKGVNALSAQLAVETLDGAQVWGLDATDRPRVAAFMRGIARTGALKLDHPGLDTVATRDGDNLLIQNDIGTNDVHVLVLRVTSLMLTMTYSDLHDVRFDFFRDLVADTGASWSVSNAQAAHLNAGHAYRVGVATVEAASEGALREALEAIAARIVFLIDWNRARKRLQAFVDKDHAVALLGEAARREYGHMPWLRAGGEALIWEAMAAQGAETFRLGDRLDAVLGEDACSGFLLGALRLASEASRLQRPASLVQDEIRLLLARVLRSRSAEFDVLQDHAAYCQALAQLLNDALLQGAERDAAGATQLAERAKRWEREADELVMNARERARRQAHWRTFATLIEGADEIADALEEAVFTLSLVADGHAGGWTAATRSALRAMSGIVASAAADQVRLIVILRDLDASSDASDHEEFLSACWRILQAERRTDELLRSTQRTLARDLRSAAELMLANDLAAALERTTDHLLALCYALRDHAFERSRAPT